MTRVKALFRSWAIRCTGKQVYAPLHRAEWLAKIAERGVRRRAEFYYQQLDVLSSLRQQVRRKLLVESKKHKAWQTCLATCPLSAEHLLYRRHLGGDLAFAVPRLRLCQILQIVYKVAVVARRSVRLPPQAQNHSKFRMGSFRGEGK